jgi:hypothetical protein
MKGAPDWRVEMHLEWRDKQENSDVEKSFEEVLGGVKSRDNEADQSSTMARGGRLLEGLWKIKDGAAGRSKLEFLGMGEDEREWPAGLEKAVGVSNVIAGKNVPLPPIWIKATVGKRRRWMKKLRNKKKG